MKLRLYGAWGKRGGDGGEGIDTVVGLECKVKVLRSGSKGELDGEE